ncbi:MAG: N-acetylmuramoyl-L-alanine amidase [Acidobacteria bacterium]|nr:N-acetylmuramoyl-L-alanine amidase [Acidobacteriota bacterium]
MPWSKHPPREARLGLALFCLAGISALSAFLLSAAPLDEKRISIFSTVANYTLPVVERNGVDYTGLLELLEPLGGVSARLDNQRWKMRYNNVDGEFLPGQNYARVAGQSIPLKAPFLLENNRGLVPLTSIPTILPRFLGGPVSFREASRRLFIGNVGVHFTAQANRNAGPRLVLDFTSPVNPMVATEPGKLRMVFSHEPLLGPGTHTLTFGLPAIPSATYSENNGVAEIAVTGSVPLFASFSNDGRTITITPAPQAPATPLLPAAAPTPAPAPAVANLPPPAVPQYFAVVDAAHGGAETGAFLSPQLAEKDVTLSFARALRQQLQSRGLPALVLRDGDATLSLDQRASLTNQTKPSVYLCIHAVSQGNGVQVYTALLPIGGDNHGPFVDWQTAQSSLRAVSQKIAVQMAGALQKNQITARIQQAPLRPLNNLTVPALAIEIAPPAGGVPELASSAYQQSVAIAVTNALVTARMQGDLP